MTYPQVIGEFKTINAVLSGKSLARFGDGELKLMDGGGYMREPGCAELGSELLKVLQDPDVNCLVGIPTMSPAGPKYDNWMRHAERFAKILRPNDVCYHSAFITRPDSAPWINVGKFAAKVESIWKDKRVAVLSEPENKIVKAVRLSAKRMKKIPCPSREAYAEIDRLEDEIVRSKPEVALLCCGPTATCLANRLASRGIHAVDIGSAGGYLLRLLLAKRPTRASL
jgi:hypothetical protein